MSKEARQVPFTAYLEPTLWALAQTAVAQDNSTASSYVRQLILRDLKRRGILTDDIMLALLDGTGMDKIIAAQDAIKGVEALKSATAQVSIAEAEAEADKLDELVGTKPQ